MHLIFNIDKKYNTSNVYQNIFLFIAHVGDTLRHVNNGNKFNLTNKKKHIMKLK